MLKFLQASPHCIISNTQKCMKRKYKKAMYNINKVLYQTDGFSLNRISLNKPTDPFAILA